MAQGNSTTPKGQKTKAQSLPVVLPSDQIVPVKIDGISDPIQIQSADGSPAGVQLQDASGAPLETDNGKLKVSLDKTNPVPISQGFLDVVCNGNTLNGNLFNPIDCSGYTTIFLQLTGTFVATVAFQGSNDLQTWSAVFGYPPATGALVSSATAVGQWEIPIRMKYFRINTTAYTSGVVQGVARFSPLSPQSFITSMGSTATGADAFANNVLNPQTPTGTSGKLGVAPSVYNGTTWDLLREAANATNSTGVGIQATSPTLQFDDVSPTSITENQFGHQRMSSNRNAYGQIRDAQGNERGVNVGADNKMQVRDDNNYSINELNSVILQSILDAITALPQNQNTLDPQYGRIVAVQGTSVDKIKTANITISASTTETTLFIAPSGSFAHLRSIIISNTSASTACRIDLRDTTAGTVIHTFQTVGGAPSVGISGGGSVVIPHTVRGGSWTITCSASTTDIRVSATFEIA